MSDHHTALINIMVLTAASDGEINDQEFRTMGNLIDTLPVFENYDPDDLPLACNEIVSLLSDGQDLERILDEIKRTLPERLRETAYLVACETAATDHMLEQEELRVLELIRHRLDIDRLHAAAIERGVRARLKT